jgi:hypothetical protein
MRLSFEGVIAQDCQDSDSIPLITVCRRIGFSHKLPLVILNCTVLSLFCMTNIQIIDVPCDIYQTLDSFLFSHETLSLYTCKSRTFVSYKDI